MPSSCRDQIVEILEKYDQGEISLTGIYDEAEYLSETLCPEDYPEFSRNDPEYFYIDVLCFLESFHWVLPEDVPFIKYCLKMLLQTCV